MGIPAGKVASSGTAEERDDSVWYMELADNTGAASAGGSDNSQARGDLAPQT